MKSFAPILGSVLALVGCASHRVDGTRPQPDKIGVRTELVKQQAMHDYVLADTYYDSSANTVYAYTILDRYWKREPIEVIEFIPGNVAVPCSSPDSRYELVRQAQGLLVRDLSSRNEVLIDSRGHANRQCWQSGGTRLVYWQSGASHPTEKSYGDGHIQVYDVADGQSRTIASGSSPTWSPDGKWIGFDDGKRYVIVNPDTSKRRELFDTEDLWYGSGIGGWSPDSQFIVYKDLGGPMGGFLIWGLQCPEPYRIWVYRIRDGAKDWVADSCKGPPCPVFMKRKQSGATNATRLITRH